MKIIIDDGEVSLYEKCQAILQDPSILLIKEVIHIGDAIIKSNEDEDMCIFERKTLSDLLSSIKDGRYEEQSYRLTHTTGLHMHNVVYIIEGMMSTIYSEKDKLLIYSSITSLNYYKGFSVFRTINVQETAELIIGMTVKIQKNELKNMKPSWNKTDLLIDNQYSSVIKKVKKENITINNIDEIMPSQIPGVSNIISQIIIHKYGTIRQLMNSLELDNNCLKGLTYELKGKPRKVSSLAIKNIQKFLVKSIVLTAQVTLSTTADSPP